MKKRASISYLVIGLICWIGFSFFSDEESKPRVLVFSKTKGWKHSSIPFGVKALEQLAKENNFEIDTTTDANTFSDENLKKFAAVIFNNTTGNVLNGEQQAVFERYIQAGGGYVGIHAAADTEYDWPWYGKLVGAWFESHPSNPNVRTATIRLEDKQHFSTSSLQDKWQRSDEWYNYKSYYSDLKFLLFLDENTYDGGTNGAKHPISWYHEFDGGRAFYTGLGHTDESYSEEAFLKHLAGGIRYAIGEGKPLNYSKAYAVVTPEQNRFVKKVLVGNLDAPMELACAPDGRIFFTELMGKLTMYDTRTGKSKLVAKLPITNAGGTGLIGVTVDPNFSKNNFIYLYYAPAGQTVEPIYFNLSRFSITANNELNRSSEKVLLRVPVQKNSGSHHGGSLAWDKENNLYLSTGDGSSPFPSNGYAPLDERPGDEYYSLDAQRSAGNTNDFKGKILRIHPEPDGTYTIPEGNLFPKGMAKTKPEIYIMGVRNPYRIAVNPKTSVLYWGDIGPDAGNSSNRGPKGYDEFNQAKAAGNYGWPYLIANNQAYAKWDFATNQPGGLFKAEAPINTSPNNTGLNQLPPAKEAMIWYPYDASEKFPELGVGGRCAIGGTFYTYSKTGGAPNKFPEYYDGTLFVAEWMRNWVINLRFDKDENYLRNEPFMQGNGDFKRPIDMAFGNDGLMYMLEYGSVYGAANEDARLVRIEYNTGNRKPIAVASVYDSLLVDSIYKNAYLTSDTRKVLVVKEITGQAPLRVTVTSRGSKDLDDDDVLSYQWMFDGKKLSATTAQASYTYPKPGNYKAILTVRDRGGLVARDTIAVKVGNTKPKLWVAAVNTSFYQNNQPFVYSIKAFDKEDKQIDKSKIKTYHIYEAAPSKIDDGVKTITSILSAEKSYPGKALLASSDCNSCHTLNKTSVGPSYVAIAQRYKNSKGVVEQLARKVINGGGGAWGKTHVMSAHPQLSASDAQEIVRYVLSVTEKKTAVPQIPANGQLVLKYNEKEPQGQHKIIAEYTDRGGTSIGPLTAIETISLRPAKINAAYADEHPGFARFRDNLTEGGHKSYLLFKNIDLTSIKSLVYRYASKDGGGEIELRIDSRAGRIISSTPVESTGSFDKFKQATGIIKNPISGKHDLYIIASKKDLPNDAIVKFGDIEFQF